MHKVLSIGDSIQCGELKSHSIFERVVNFEYIKRSNFLVTICKESIGKGPFNLIVDDSTFDQIKTSQEISILNNELKFGEHSLLFSDNEIYKSEILDLTSGVNLDSYDRNRFVFGDKIFYFSKGRSKIEFLLAGLSTEESNSSFDQAFQNHFLEGVMKLFSEDFTDGVKKLRGVGVGLTPTGDDYLSGFMLGIWLTHLLYRRQTVTELDKILSTIFSEAIGENMISNSALYAAKSGLVTEKMKALILALGSEGFDSKIDFILSDLCDVGHSSGVDTLIGFFMTLRRSNPWWSKG